MKILKNSYLLVVLSAVLFFVIGCGQQLSGTLTLYTSQPDADVESLVTAFNEKYPDIKVDIFRSGTEEVISKLLAEHQAGTIQADVLLVADAVTFENLKQQDLLLSYKSDETKKIPAQFVDEAGMYTGTKIISNAIIYNTNSEATAPSSWMDLTKAEANGQAIMPSPLYSGAAAYNLGVMVRLKDLGWDFYNKLKKNHVTLGKGNGGIIQAVAAGEKAYGMVVDFMAARAQKEGSPVELVYPEEGVTAITEPIGIIKNTKNEKAAKSFVDFILSEEGQKLAVEQGYTPIREDMEAPEGLKSISDLKVLESDIQELYHAREADKTKFSKIFGI